MSLPARIYTVILLCTITWCAALFLAPILAGGTGVVHAAGGFLYQFFHPICHQLEERSFHIAGRQLAVCSRCSSIYLAFLAGTILLPLVAKRVVPSRLLLALSVAPMLLDVLTGALGLHEVSNATRAVTGAMFGLVIPFFVIPAAIDAVTKTLCHPSVPLSPGTIPQSIQKGSSHA